MNTPIIRAGDTHAFTFHMPSPFVASPKLALRSVKRFWMAFLCFLLAWANVTFSTFGQNTVNIDLAEFAHATSLPLHHGDSLSFTFELGSSAQTAGMVCGYQISLQFPKLLAAPSEVLVSVAGSWVGTAANGSPSSLYHPSESQLDFGYERTDLLGQVGAGRLAVICLVRPGGFAPSEDRVTVSGGLVMVDNVDFKQALGQQASSPAVKVFPMPATDHLQVEAQGEFSYLLIHPGGGILNRGLGNGRVRMPLEGLPRGVYVLEIRQTHGTSRQKVLLR